MIPMQTLPYQLPIDLGSEPPRHGGQCQLQVADAEREMGVFVTAVERKGGPVAAARAAEYWIDLAERVSPLSLDGEPNWRQLTVFASSRLAMEGGMNAFSVRDEEGRCKQK